MKLTLIAVCSAILISCNSEVKNPESTKSDSSEAGTTTLAAEPKAEEWVPVDSATAMKAMMESGTPGKEQALLAKANGNWQAEITMWDSPEATPSKFKGLVTNKMVMGGRYQVSNFKGNMMGMPFEGTSTTGYDNARKLWVSTWVDNMSTGIMNMEGTSDDASKTVTYTGKMICPANGKMCEIKQVMKTIDDKTEIMEMYGPDMKTGKQFKNMEMKLTKG